MIDEVKHWNGILTEVSAATDIGQKPAIMIRTAGTKPIPFADFKMPAGSKLRLIDVEINEKDGVLFSSDDEDFKIITKMTAGNVSGGVVQIGQKEYPVLAIQKMGSSSKWSFVLDYDEDEPKEAPPPKKNKYEKS